ncbi:MAG: ABC-F family ATP-binding cassette domain-containing protein, partial [Rhodospirillaceae bacterium]|nr:ABC-F family ATP-binding cassette domain-containing protein [Rhodospirillaceae bacterium]
MLHINDLSFRIGARVLLEGATVHVAANQRVGLIGRNGSGKTTLFRLIRGEAQPSGGSFAVRARARLGWVSQDAPDGEISLLDCVLDADAERKALLDELTHLETVPQTEAGLRIAEIHERLISIDAHSAPARAAMILTGLGFPSEQHSLPVSHFSGGWRMRVALAAALFPRPELLLLDEPTNHLDLEATLWLQNHLTSYPGTLIIISHDRDLLNAVPDRIIHLDQKRLVAYGGNYDAFERTRRMKMDLAAKAFSKQLEQRRKIQGFIDRFRAKATKARQAQSRIKMLEKMDVPVPIVEDKAISFDFPDPDQLSPPLITIEDGIVGYDGKAVLKGLNLRIDTDDRIALLGSNGNGKSTLAKLLSERIGLISGTMRRSAKLKIGYFAQHQTEELTLSASPLEHMAAKMPMATEAKVRAHLGRFGFGAELADCKVSTLSGGEKSRLLFALMTREAPHILILDEPTNHLDIDSREALISALNAYDGAVILISHDTHLVDMVADRLWRVADGQCLPFDGDLTDYRKTL